jgi:hypothetical protein
VKDAEGRHLFGNKVICDPASEDVLGKADQDLVWRKDANAQQAHDRQVLETAKTSYIHEQVWQSVHGDPTLNVCNWVGELDGQRCCFGISRIRS